MLTTKSYHASPINHQPTTMPPGLMDMLRSNAFSISNPTKWLEPCFCLVIKNHAFPISSGPIFTPLDKLWRAKTCIRPKNGYSLYFYTQSNRSQSMRQSDVKQQITCFKLKLFGYRRYNWKSTFSNENDRTPLTSVYMMLWTFSSLSLNLAPYIILHMHFFLHMHTKTWCFLNNGGLRLQRL